MVKKLPTRKDVAEKAGVSLTVVSYVINNNRYVKEEKRVAVLKAMSELNYRPNKFARALKGKQVKHIILLIDRLQTEGYGKFLGYIQKHARAKGYLVSVEIVDNSDKFVQDIINWQVDGLIINSIKFAEKYIQQLADSGIPVVLIENRKYNITKAARLNTGLYEATSNVIKFLYSIGCRNIVYVDRISDEFYSGMDDFRYAAYVDTMKKYNLESSIRIISGCKTSDELSSRINFEMNLKKFDGLFGRNDFVAMVAMNSLIRAGYKIPEDVSIIGLNNISYSTISIPTLSTLSPRREEMAIECVNIIEKMYQSKEIPQKVTIKPELIFRESVKMHK